MLAQALPIWIDLEEQLEIVISSVRDVRVDEMHSPLELCVAYLL